MNITFLLRFWPNYGGGETVTRVLANKFAEDGYTVSIVYLWDTIEIGRPYIDRRIKEYKIPGISSPVDDNVIQKSDYKLIQKRLRDYLRNNKTDIIINQWLPAKLVYKANIDFSSKIINCHHTSINTNPPEGKIINKIFFMMFKERGIKYYIKRHLADFYKYAEYFVFLSKSYIKDFKDIFDIKNTHKKFWAIPNPLLSNEFLPSNLIISKENEILFVGRIVESIKRITYILDAWQILQNQRKTDGWKLTIIGDGPDLEKSKAYAGKYQLQNIGFTGFQDPAEYYKRSAILVFCSYSEGWGMVLTEAQQNGCVPVVMDSFASLHEIVEHGKNGLIIPNNDISGFAEAMETLMFNEEYRRQLAETALETCRKFSVDNVARQWEELFKEIL